MNIIDSSAGLRPWRGVVLIAAGFALLIPAIVFIALEKPWSLAAFYAAVSVAFVLLVTGAFMLLAVARRAGELRTFLLVSSVVTFVSTLVFQPEIFVPGWIVTVGALLFALRSAEERLRCRWTITIAIILLLLSAGVLTAAWVLVSIRDAAGID